MASPTHFLCLLILCLSSVFILPTSSFSLSLKLTNNLQKLHYSQNSHEFISTVAQSTLHRAYHIKHHQKNPASTPLFARSAGDYSINLSLGTPPQKIPAFFDTGSSLVWVPCTSTYSCSNCTTNNSTITTYKPKQSSSKKRINCVDKKCQWLDQPGNPVSCPSCNRTLPGDCVRPCSYIQEYGSGDTSGNALFEKLNLNTKVVPGFLFGCSLLSDSMPEGIAGFGRNQMSLPTQLKLTKFSHCLVSHKFDDTVKSSSLILGDSDVVAGVAYTPLLKNPPTLPLTGYYYGHLEQITVGKKFVKLPSKILFTDPNGNGGTIVDSGSTLTALAPGLFGPVTNAYTNQMPMGLRNRVEVGHSSLGNLLCVNVTGGEKGVNFPEVAFHFKGGVKMDLTVGNYLTGGPDLLCLPFVNTTFAVGETGAGPAVILGNYQQQNYHVEYDLKNERFGFKQQVC